MAMTMHVDIVSAEAEIFSGIAAMVIAPGELGDIGILPRHSPLLSRLKPGEVRVQTPEGQEDSYFISGGVLEIQPHVVTVLADTAVRAEDLDEAAAIEAKRKAEEAMADKKSDFDYARARAELIEAAARLETINKLRRHKRQ